MTSVRLQLRSECALKKQNIQILPEPKAGHKITTLRKKNSKGGCYRELEGTLITALAAQTTQKVKFM